MPTQRVLIQAAAITLAALLALVSTVAGAQESAEPARPSAPAEAPPQAADPLRSLLQTLRDDSARAALIAELERLAGEPSAVEGETTSPAQVAPAGADGTPRRQTEPATVAVPADALPTGVTDATPAIPVEAAVPEPGEPAAEGAAAADGEAAEATEPLADAQGAALAEPAAEAEPGPSLGRRLAILTTNTIEGLANQAVEFANGLAATQRRLTALSGERADALYDAAIDLLAIIVATVVIFLALRWPARRIFRRMHGPAAEGSPARRIGLWFVGVAIDAMTVILAWALGTGLVLAVFGEEMALNVNQTLYLNAFLAVQLVKVGVRSVLSPNTPSLRLVPLTDEAATYWTNHVGGIVSILGYGLLLVTPIVNQTVSIFTGRAVQVVIFGVALLWSMALVIRHRKAPSQWLSERAEAAGGDPTLRALAAVARFWHWAAIALLVSVFVNAVSQAGDVAGILQTTARVIAVVVVGAVVGAMMARTARKGVRLPESVVGSMPMLESRVNGFLRRFLGVARFVVAVATLAVAIDATGVYDVGGWFSRQFGEDFAAAAISVTLIVVVAFAMWLALASWVDFRLNPDRPTAATSREQTLLTLARNAATIAIVVIGAMFALSELGLDIAPLLASAGVFGLAIGFGAQKLVQDIITGVFIQFENAINVGDVVTVAGTSGVVEKLTIRSVSLRALDGTFHIIPFSSVDMVSNFMRGFAFYVADVGIAYREDIDEGKRLMHLAYDDLKANPEVGPELLGDLQWFGVETLGDSAVVLRARLRTKPGSQWGVGRAYNEAVKKRLDAAGVEIPFPHMTVWFGENKDGTAPAARFARVGGDKEAPVEKSAPTIEGRSREPNARRPSQDMPFDDEAAGADGEQR